MNIEEIRNQIYSKKLLIKKNRKWNKWIITEIEWN